jgi:hypothetical protein
MPLKQSSKSSKNVLLILAMALFIVALSLVILSSLTPTQRKSLSLTGGSYADGYNAARDQAMKLGMPGLIAETKMASGKVTAVNGDKITIETNFFVDEKVDGVGSSRTVTLAPNGKVTLQTQLKPEEMGKKNEEFQQALKSFDGKGNPPTPPSLFEQKVGKISDIAVGDMLMIQSDSNVRLEKTISATQMNVIKMIEPVQTK